MPYSDTLFLNLLSRVEHGFGRLEEGQKLNRQAAEQRAQHLERQIVEHRQETRTELREIRSKMERSKAPSVTGYLKVASLLYEHWRTVLGVLLVLSGLIMGQSPGEIKKTVTAWVGSPAK